MLRFEECGVDALNNRGLAVHTAELVVEHAKRGGGGGGLVGVEFHPPQYTILSYIIFICLYANCELYHPPLPDYVQGNGAKSLLHLNASSTRTRLLERCYKGHVAVTEQTDHVVEPSLVETGHNLPAPHLPSLRVCRDQPFPHDWLQNFRQNALVEIVVVGFEHVTGLEGVGYYQEGLRTEAQLVRRPVLLVISLEAYEHRPIRDIRNLTSCQRRAIPGLRIAVNLLYVGFQHKGRVAKRARFALRSALEEGELPNSIPPEWERFFLVNGRCGRGGGDGEDLRGW